MDYELKGKHALVTGGSRGIGRAVALALAAQGVAVTASHVQDGEPARSLAAELNGNGAVIRADVTKPDEVAELVRASCERFGPLDILVNNAGVISHLPLERMPSEEWQRIFDTNVTGMYHMVRTAIPHFTDTASIINITSAVARHGMPGAAHYVASKAAVMGLTRALCKELGPKGVRVNAIASGLIETDQMKAVPPEGKARYAAMTSVGRIGAPEEIAAAVLFLASDAASYITGAVLDVDGGI